MGFMGDIAKGLLLLMGVGILSEKLGAGPGLAGLGTGLASIFGAPFTGIAGGITDIGQALGAFFKPITDFLSQIFGWAGVNGGNGTGGDTGGNTSGDITMNSSLFKEWYLSFPVPGPELGEYPVAGWYLAHGYPYGEWTSWESWYSALYGVGTVGGGFGGGGGGTKSPWTWLTRTETVCMEHNNAW